MLRKIIAAVLLTNAVAGCAAGRATTEAACSGFKPIRPTTADVGAISDKLAGQILDHNAFGARACGWRP